MIEGFDLKCHRERMDDALLDITIGHCRTIGFPLVVNIMQRKPALISL